MSDDVIITDNLAKALQTGDTNTIIAERFRLRQVEQPQNLAELEEAVATHVPRDELFSALKAALNRPENGQLHEYAFIDANGLPTDREHASRFQAGPTGNAFYWAFDGDVEHVDAILKPLPTSAKKQVSTMLENDVRQAPTLDIARESINTTLTTIFDNLLQNAGEQYDPMLTQIARDLDRADTLNGVVRPGQFLKRLQDTYHEAALHTLCSGEIIGAHILGDLGLAERLDEEVTQRIVDGPITPGLLRAAGHTGITAEAFYNLTREHPKSGRVVLHPAIHKLLDSNNRQDWDAARTLATQLDTIRDDYFDDFDTELRLRTLIKLSNLEEHDTQAYALAINYGFNKHAQYHANRINEVGRTNTSSKLATEPLDHLIFSEDARRIEQGLQIVDKVEYTGSYVRACNKVIDAQFRQENVPVLATILANHYDIHAKIVEHLTTLATRENVFVPGAVELAERFDIYTHNEHNYAGQVADAYEKAQQHLFVAEVEKLINNK